MDLSVRSIEKLFNDYDIYDQSFKREIIAIITGKDSIEVLKHKLSITNNFNYI